MLGILNYGVGNIGSLINMYSFLETDVYVVETAEDLQKVDKLILPGVGAFDRAMSELQKRNFIDPLNDFALIKKRPVLGICLGMQLLANQSEEGQLPGLGWIDAKVKKIPTKLDGSLKVPHIGWSSIDVQQESVLFTGKNEQRFYFVHSYFMSCDSKKNVLATVSYGESLCCSVVRDNIYGVQFHPEKSHKYGMNLLSNFAELEF